MTLSGTEALLREAGIDSWQYEAKLLISEICGVPMHELVWQRKRDFSAPGLDEAVRRRQRREPLQYILGAAYFRGLRFSLNPDCLCPREDTEVLADEAVRLLPPGAVFCDLGTGSGAIGISVAHARPDVRAVCADISAGALDAARQNAADNGVADRCRFVLCDMTRPEQLGALGCFDAVLSNPPYIPTPVLSTLPPELAYEPRRALDGGEDGLVFYRAILSCPGLCRPEGFYLFEIGYDEGEALRALGASFGLRAEIGKDLGGNDRTVCLRRN